MKRNTIIVAALIGGMLLSGCTQQPDTPVVHVTDITINAETAMTLHPGDTYDFTVTVAPEDATTKDVTWSSSNPAIVTVNNGHIEALANGSSIITATCETISKSVTVTVETLPTGLTLDYETVELEKGATQTLHATVAPETSSYKTVTWSSDNDAVATVSEEGLVTAKSRGIAHITAALTGSELTATCAVTVFEQFAISRGEDSYSGINLSFPESAKVGSEVTVSVTEAVEESYELDLVKVNVNEATYAVVEGQFSFEMPAQAVVLSVIYAPAIVSHVVTVYNSEEIAELFTVTGDVWESKKGHELSFTVTNNVPEKYEITNVRLSGTYASTYENGTLTFTMPDADVAIVIEYQGVELSVGLSEAIEGVSLYNVAERKTITDGKATYGDKVQVQFSSSYLGAHNVEGIKLNDGDLIALEEGKTSIEFTLEAATVVTVVAADVEYDFTLASTDHITLSVQNSEGTVITKSKVGEVVHVIATITEPDKTSLKTLTVTYETNDYYTPTKVINLNTDEHKDETGYFFEVPQAKKGTALVFALEEVYAAPYAGYAFVGSYVGNDIYNFNKTINSTSSTYDITIDEEGNVTNGSYKSTISSYDAETGVIELANGNSMYFNENVLVYGYQLGAIESSDMVVVIKKPDGGYIYRAEMFLNGAYTVMNTTDSEGNQIGSMFYSKASNTFTFGVTFEMVTGDYITAQNAEYNIKKDGVTLLGVYSEGSDYTYAKNRKILDGVQGTYVGIEGEEAEESTLVLDGKGAGTYKGEAVQYTIEDGKVVIVTKDDSKSYTRTFTLGEGTFTVDVKSEDLPDYPAYYEHSYKISKSNYEITITFTGLDSVNIAVYGKRTGKTTNYTGTLAVAESGEMTITNATLGYLKVTYDSENNKLVVTARQANSSWSDYSVAVGNEFAFAA